MKPKIKITICDIVTIIIALVIAPVTSLLVYDSLKKDKVETVSIEYNPIAKSVFDNLVTVCKENKDTDFILVCFVNSNMEILQKIDRYNSWSEDYKQQIFNKINLSFKRGAYNHLLIPLKSQDRGVSV